MALLRLQRGEVDIAGDGIPPAKFLEIKNSPDGAQMIVDGEQLHTGYLTLNTKVKPLDNVKVRQAINMAVNKERITRILNGRATPANQPLPPLMPATTRASPAMPSTSRRPRHCLPKQASPMGSRPCSTRPTPIRSRASPRRSSRIWRRSASRPRFARLPRAM